MVLSVQNDQHLMIKADVSACMGERGGRVELGGGGRENGRGGGGGGKRMNGIMSLNMTLFKKCMCCAFVMVFQTALFLTFYMLGSCFRTLTEILVSV